MAHRAGQSGSGTTGEARTGGAELWTDAAAQRRFVNLWKAIAARYAGSEVIAGDDPPSTSLRADSRSPPTCWWTCMTGP